jgi:hypothetical protein
MVWFSCIDIPENGINFIRSWHENLPLKGVKKEAFSLPVRDELMG